MTLHFLRIGKAALLPLPPHLKSCVLATQHEHMIITHEQRKCLQSVKFLLCI